MRKKQGKEILLKGILSGCLLFNHFSGFITIARAASMNNQSQETLFTEENQLNESSNLENDNQHFIDSNNEEILDSSNTETSEVEAGENTEDEVPNQEESLVNPEEENQGEQQESLIPEVEDISDEDAINVKEETLVISEEESVLEKEPIEAISESRSIGSGLVQLWQVVPEGQNQEGKTTSEIMKALQCRPNHNLYPLNGQSQHQTYVNSCYVDDALYLGEDDTYYYIYLSGYEGKVPKSETHTFSLDLNGDGKYVNYQIQTVAYYIPGSTVKAISDDEVIRPDAPELNYYDQHLNKYSEAEARSIDLYSTATVQSPSYYANDNGTLVHYITNNVKVANNYSKVTVGKAPSWMSSGVKYYSYDGIYFYTNWQNIRVNGQGAVNQNNPFYNYYQYLPFRSKTNYSANAIDSYTNNNGGTGGKLVNTGQYFYAVQDNYGINGALQYAMGIHESGWGKSSLSINKNNLFGMNATDNNPYGNGTSFPTVEAGINYHADRYLSWGYTDPIDDYRYFGSHVGNKGSGMNVKYASDPFWGEKIAGWYYRFDNTNGLKDYNYYSIGMKVSNSVLDVKSSANASSTTLYQTKNKKSNLTISNYPVLITGESNDFYSVKTDTPIVNGKPSFNQQYKWSQTNGYISKNSIMITNHTNYKTPSSWKESNTINHSLEMTLDSTGNVDIKGKVYIPYLEMKSVEDTDIYIVLKNPKGQDIYYKADRNKNGYGLIDGYDYSYSGFELTLPKGDLQQAGDYDLYIKVVDNSSGEYMINRLTKLSNPNTVVNHALGRQVITISSSGGIKISIKNQLIDELVQATTTNFVDDKLVIKGKAYIPTYESPNANALVTTIIIKDPMGKDTAFATSINAEGYGVISGYDYTYSGFEVKVPLSYFKTTGSYKVYIKMVDKATGHTVIKLLTGAESLGKVDQKISLNTIVALYSQPNITLEVTDKKTDEIKQEATVSVKNQQLVIEGKAYIPNYEMAEKGQVSTQIIIKNPSGKDRYYTVEQQTAGYGVVGNADYTYSGYKLTIPSNELSELGNYQVFIKMVDKATGHMVIKSLTGLKNTGAVNQQLLGNNLITVKEQSGVKLTLTSRKVDEIKQEATVSVKNQQLVIEGKAYIPNYEMAEKGQVSTQIIIKNPSGKDRYYTVEQQTAGYGVVGNADYTYSGYKLTIPSNELSELGNYQVFIKMVDKATGHMVIKSLTGLKNTGAVNQQLLGNNLITVKEQSGVKLTLTSRKVDEIKQEATVSVKNQQLVIEGKAYIPNYEMAEKGQVSTQIIIKNPSGKDRYYTIEQQTAGYGVVGNADYTYSGYKLTIPSNELSELGNYQVFIKMVDKATGHMVIKSLTGLKNTGAVNQQLLGNNLITVKEQSGVKLTLTSRKVDEIKQEATVSVKNQQLVIEGKAYIPNYEMAEKGQVSTQIIIKNPSGKDRYYTVEQQTAGYGVVGNVDYTYSGYKLTIPSNELSELGNYQVFIKMVDKATGHMVIKSLSNLKSNTLNFSLDVGRNLIISDKLNINFIIK